MRNLIDYLILYILMFFESFIWTVMDIARRTRMRHSRRMHERLKPPTVVDDERSPADIKNKAQE